MSDDTTIVGGDRVALLTQMALAIITNANPNWHGCSAREAVILAKEIIAEVEHPTPEPPPVATTLFYRKSA